MSEVENWGVFAMKGFSFQFDQTIKHILENKDSEIYFESNQDIDFDGQVLQIKNHESTRYYDSKIRKPVMQLIKCYQEDPDKIYLLFAHFCDRSPQREQLDLERLNSILGTENHQFRDDEKEDFLRNFILEFAGDYEANYRNLISQIKQAFSCDEDQAEIKHDLITQFLMKKLYDSPDSIEGRKTSFEEIAYYLNQCNSIVFWWEYEKKISQQEYRRKSLSIVQRQNFWRQKIILYFGAYEYRNILNIIEYVANKKRENRSNARILIVVENGLVVQEIKQHLIQNSIDFNDGFINYWFNYNLFKDYHLSSNNFFQISLISKDIYELYFSNIRSDFLITESIIFNNVFWKWIGRERFLPKIDWEDIQYLFDNLR